MQTSLLILLLTAILALFSGRIRHPAERWLSGRPQGILAVAILLGCVLCMAAAAANAFNFTFGAVALTYTMLPATVALLGRRSVSPSWIEPLIIALLWLPLEFPAAAPLIPRRAQGFVHSAAYGVAILLALAIFLLYRRFDGMRYRLPTRASDVVAPVLVFLLAAPVLVLTGRAVGFIPPFHAPQISAARIAWIYLLILVATALPEEILFRALVQNWIVRKFGDSNLSILASSVVFGAAHLNNGPDAAPNWPYAVVATIAGFAFGKVFQRSSSVVSSALLHALVNTTKRAFF